VPIITKREEGTFLILYNRDEYVLIDTIVYDYPKFHLSMDCFWVEVVSGELVWKEA
jgi:hypothetical protein